LTLPEQQLFAALQVMVASLQTEPAGLHDIALLQRPTESVGLVLLQ
jgi:hypothetical protein